MHSCPNCGQACYCCGDIEDCETDPTAEDRCICCDEDDDDDDDDDFDPFHDQPDPLPRDISIRTADQLRRVIS